MWIFQRPEDIVLAEEVYPIYYKDDLYNPHVDLELEGEKISFIIDTGAVYSMVSLKLLQEWDWVEYIEPVAESHETIGCIGLELRLKGTIFTDRFLVIPQDYNMLGTRALSHFSAIIDLDSHKLTLREFVPEVWEKEAVDVVCVEGQEVSVFVDTGYEGFLEGQLETAQELKLALKDISHEQFMIIGLEEDQLVLYEAEGVCVRAFGTEKRGRLYVTAKRNTGDAQMLLGLEFLMGATIHFEKGTPQITFPGKAEAKAAARSL